MSKWVVRKAARALVAGERFVFAEEDGGENQVLTVESVSEAFGTVMVYVEEIDAELLFMHGSTVTLVEPEPEPEPVGVGAPTPRIDLEFLWNEVQCAADTMLDINNGGTWGSFTCTEIEALAGVFRAAGRDDTADFIINKHAESDEADDLHTKEDHDEPA